MDDVIIVGAGSAGLSIYYQLNRLGIRSRILDESNEVAHSWRSRHPQLQLNTHRWYSHQPGMHIPKEYGNWVSRDDYVRYLEDYVKMIEIPIEFGTRVTKINRHQNAWLLETSKGNVYAKHVIISCGANRIPRMPQIPGLISFNGIVIHAAHFGDAASYDGKSVLIIGGGNSAFDIGNHLIKRPLKELKISIRTAPGISAKDVFRFPMHVLSVWMRKWPLPVQDYLFRSTQSMLFGNLKKFNMGESPRNVFTKHSNDGITVSVDDGFINAIKQGKVNVVKEIIRIDNTIATAVNGEQIAPDVIICATGYHPGLEPIIEHLNVLDSYGIPTTTGSQVNPKVPGLWFMGLRGYIWGNMYEQVLQSKKLAKCIVKNLSGR